MKYIATVLFLLFCFLFSFTISVNAQVLQNDVIINEFLPNPTSALDGKEYVELLVTSASPVTLSGFRLSDVSSKGAAGGTTEGHLDFPNQPYLENLVQGTRIVVVLSVPLGNPNIYSLEDTDPSDSLLILFTSALAGGSMFASGTMDLSTNENIVLLDGPTGTSNTIDYVAVGTNVSLSGFPDARFYEIPPDTLPSSASGTVTYFTNDRSSGMNNDTGSTVIWKVNRPSSEKSPGFRNPNQNFPWITAVSGDGVVALKNVTSSEVTLLNSTVFRRDATEQEIEISVVGGVNGVLDTVHIDVPNDWAGLSEGNVTLGGNFTGRIFTISGNRITIPEADLEFVPGTVRVTGLTTPNPQGAGVDGIYIWTVSTAIAGMPAQNVGASPQARVIIPIQNVRTGGVDGFGNSDAAGLSPVMINKTVALQGVVTVQDSILATTSTTSFFIQDGDYGLQVFRGSANSSSLFTRGSQIIVVGNLTGFKGNTEIIPASIGAPDFFVEGSATIPAPIVLSSIAQISEEYEGRLVKITDVDFDSAGNTFKVMSSTAGAKFQKNGVYRSMHLNAADSVGGKAGLRPKKIIGTIIPPNADIIGVVYHRTDFDTTDVAKRNAYKLAPRDIDDITRYSTIGGTVFHDLNANAAKDNGEPGLENWDVSLTDQSISDVTDANGAYLLKGVLAGNYVITQTSQSGWVQTFPVPGTHPITVNQGTVVSGYNFGNFKNGLITGIIYEDDNGNGILDGSEFGSAVSEVYLSYNSLENYIDTTVADEDGNFSFFGLSTGTYFITMGEVLGGHFTEPELDSASGQNFHTVTLSTAASSFNGNFGYFYLGGISGYKFFDANKNGVRDMITPIVGGSILEPAIPDWKIYLTLNSSVVDSQFTDANGIYHFTELVAGNYTVNEARVSGWVQTFPAANANHNVSITSSGQNVTDKYFGNRKSRRGLKIRGLRSDSLWSNRLNWDGNVVPSNEDSIEISSGDTIYVDAIPFDSLQSLTVASGGCLQFPNNVGTMKLRSNFVIDGLVNVNDALPVQFSPKFYVYGSFIGDGLFNPGKSKVSMRGNNAKIVGGSLNGKATDTTTFYELEIAGNNTTAGSDLTILSKLTLSANLSTSDKNIITVDSAIASAVAGTGKINRGKVVRKIGVGDIGAYRFHSAFNKIQYSGNGIPPTYVAVARYPDSSETGFGKYRVEKAGTIDTSNNAITVTGLTHFSRWILGQTGHKDSTGSPTYDITEEATAKVVTDIATLTLEYEPSSLTYAEDSVALYRIASGITVRKWLDADKDTNTVNDRTAKAWGLRVRNEEGTLVSSVNDTEVTLEEITAGTYSVVESDSARWTHIQTHLNGISIGTSDSISISVGVGELAVIDFINNYQPDTTKYRTFLSDLYTGKAPSLKPKKGEVPFLTTPANIRNNVITKATGLTIGTSRTDSAKAYGWIIFSEGKSMEKYFPGVAGAKAHPFDFVYITGKEPKPFVKALKNPKAAKFENHLATELAAFRINDMASRTTPKVLSEGILGSLLYNDATMETLKLNGKSLSKIVDSANVYLTHYKRIPAAKRDVYFTALDSIFTRANRAFYIGEITAEDTAHTPNFKVKGGKKISEVEYFTSPTTKEEEFTPVVSGNSIPEVFSLAQNYPNPFNPTTTIEFTLPEEAYVTLKIYNILGQEIATLYNNELLDGGFNIVKFDAARFSSGIYFYRMTATTVNDVSLTSVRKMVLMK